MGTKMSEARETKKTKLIAFRVTDEEFANIERISLALGEDPNNWCRNMIVAEAREGSGLTKTERLIYEEIARVRYLVGNGFRILFGSEEEATAATWKRITAQADQRSEKIADGLIARRQQS
jgi:hypothetical protein